MSCSKLIIRCGLIAALLITTIVFPIYGQSELPALGRTWGIGARATGMGGAFMSVADDYSATYYNPAGLALVRKMELFISMPMVQFESTTQFNGWESKADENFTKLNAIGFTLPIPTYRGSMVLAAGYNRVQNFDRAFSFSWFNPDQSPDNLNAEMTETWDVLEKGHLGEYTISFATDISPNLSIGGGLNLVRGNNDYAYNYQASDDSSFWDLDFIGNDINIDTKMSGANFRFGALYRVGNIARIGGKIELPYTVKYEESSLDHYKESWETEAPVDDSNSYEFTYKIRNPFKFGGGFSIYLPQLVISADAEYIDWTQMEYTSDPPFTKTIAELIDEEYVYLDSTQAEINRDIRDIYQPVTKLHVGAELTIPGIYAQLRAGAFYEPSPYKNAEDSQDRKYFTMGAGFLLDKQMKLDLAWTRGTWDEPRNNFSAQIPNLMQEIVINQFELTLAIRF